MSHGFYDSEGGWRGFGPPPGGAEQPPPAIRLKQTRELSEFKPILEGLVEDFGYIYWSAILEWCGTIDALYEDWQPGGLFWEVWLVIEGDGMLDDQAVIGICGLYSLDKNTDQLWLGWFGMLPAHRNSGKGSMVLKLLENEARRHGCKILRTYVDEAGKPLSFYLRHGFTRISTVGEFCKQTGHDIRHFEDPVDHVLEKRLALSDGVSSKPQTA